MNRDITGVERQAAIELARADLYFFSRWMFLQRRGYTWRRAEHHKTICDALMSVYRGECKRLIINIPPRYSKTELAVLMFIAWSMGRAPDSEFIHTSYSATLAANNSSQIRDLIQHEAYREIFPNVKLSEDSRAKDHWKTSEGGTMYSAGAGGTITGFGAGKMRDSFGGAIVIDDPHKADEAKSEQIRKGVLDWFQNTLESRKNDPERTPVILIMQRLHEDDLAGWLLGGGNGEKWDHICLSAWKEDGTPLWPEKHSADELKRMEIAAPYVFAGQYRQRPSPPEGGIFKPDAMPIIDAAPFGVTWCRGWDFASVDGGGDFTAGLKVGVMSDGRYVIADAAHGQWGPDERDTVIKNTAARDGHSVRISIPQDPGQAGKTQVLDMTRKLAGYIVHSSPESGDKITRAEPLASQVNVGNVLMIRGAWNDKLIQEMRLFPYGKFDDQIDAASRAFAHLISAADASIVTRKVRGL